MTPIKILKDARTLVERGWTQFDFARDAIGERVELRSSKATCFCAYGAVRRSGHDGGEDSSDAIYAAIDALDAVAQRQGFRGIIEYNDALVRTQADMVAIFGAAIAYLEDRQEAAS